MSDGEILSPSSSNPLDVNSIRSRIGELRDFYENSYNSPELGPEETEKVLNECALELEKKIDKIISESSNISSLPDEDLGELFERLKTELSAMEGENVKIDSEIDELSRRYVEDYSNLGSELEGISCSLNFIESQSLEKAKDGMLTDCSDHTEDRANLSNAHKDTKFKMLELSHQIEKNKTTLNSMQDLNCVLERFEAVEKVEDALTGVRVIEFEGNCIRLSLKTYIPDFENVLSQQKIEGVIEPLELNHELNIETVDGTLEPKNVEIFPNDVYIGDIVDAAKSFRQLYSPLSVTETRSSLEWFARRVQDRIALCSLRRYVVKSANKSRHSIKYLDREDMIVARMVGGVDAFIKLSQGWPFLNSALELISLKNSSQYSKEISLSFLCKIVEVANSLNANSRRNISSFVDSIEEILMQKTREELQADNSSAAK
ncbi:RNA-directed DNA polymerase (reverse transcriptase)-related family protein [Forsythia ovata]|uniref:RNA-directed DNA polymerase (Reverse transcriptase)-related family protein n=1 Tax=Forsythia ovata TaxID=205694 RepID=A0ABD1V173_9LAMI